MSDERGNEERGEERGASARERIWGGAAARVEAALRETDPDLAALVLEVAYDRVFERPGLDLRTRELLAISHLMALGADAELETHVRGALRCGATLQEVRETVIHGAMFVGFPRALAAMRVVERVERRVGAER